MGVFVSGSGVALICAVSIGFCVGLGVDEIIEVGEGDASMLVINVAEGVILSSVISMIVEVGFRDCGVVVFRCKAHADKITGINKHIRTGFTGVSP